MEELWSEDSREGTTSSFISFMSSPVSTPNIESLFSRTIYQGEKGRSNQRGQNYENGSADHIIG